MIKEKTPEKTYEELCKEIKSRGPLTCSRCHKKKLVKKKNKETGEVLYIIDMITLIKREPYVPDSEDNLIPVCANCKRWDED